MHRIDASSATVDNKFTDGSPAGGVPATTVSAGWLNDLQENICKVIEAAAVPLTKGRALDLLDAIRALGQGTSQSLLQANNGYKLHSDGFFEAWGFVASAAEPVTVIFLQQFTEIYGVKLECASSVTPTTATSYNVQAEIDQFTVTRNDGITVEPFYWRAYGKRVEPIV